MNDKEYQEMFDKLEKRYLSACKEAEADPNEGSSLGPYVLQLIASLIVEISELKKKPKEQVSPDPIKITPNDVGRGVLLRNGMTDTIYSFRDPNKEEFPIILNNSSGSHRLDGVSNLGNPDLEIIGFFDEVKE